MRPAASRRLKADVAQQVVGQPLDWRRAVLSTPQRRAQQREADPQQAVILDQFVQWRAEIPRLTQ